MRDKKKTIGLIAMLAMFVFPVFESLYVYSFSESSVMAALSGLQINVDADFNTLNSSRWATPNFRNTSWVFETETYDVSNPIRPNVTYSVNHYDMGTTDWFKWNCTEWGEWGYSFHHLTDGTLDGAGIPQYGGYPTPPATKKEAYDYMKFYVINRTEHLNHNIRPWLSFNGHYPYHHYAAEFGFDSIGSEIGENIDDYQVMMAFNRGAARQYHLPWFVDFSAWQSGTITDYYTPSTWAESGGPNKGHSLSLFQRSYMMAYMAGTSRVIAEGGCYNLFYWKTPDPSGLLQLTPLGEVGRDFAHFTRDHPNRGVTYTPIGIMIDFYHGSNGIGGSGSFIPKTFNTLEYTKGDYMTFGLLDAIYPKCWNSPVNEAGTLVNNQFGDSFDILLQNASANVLAAYPVIIMSGDIKLKDVEATRLVDYVKNGGTLVVNSAYFVPINAELQRQGQLSTLKLDPLQYVNLVPFGNGNGGNFIAFGTDYDASRLNLILQKIVSMMNPFTISSSSGSIESMVNRNANGWVLTLINNDGVTKTPRDPPVVDARQRHDVLISLNDAFLSRVMPGYSLKNVTNWMDDQLLWNQGTGGAFSDIDIGLDPGAIAVLEFRL
jgi:hypothetical protein